MSVDLKKGMKKKVPKQKRARGIIAKLKTRKPKIIGEWPLTNIYNAFIDLEPEDLYDNLINYRLTLDLATQKKEISALFYITQKLPWSMVNTFFKYMKDRKFQKFSPALANFIKYDKIRAAIEKTKQLIIQRKAVPFGGYVFNPFKDTIQHTETMGTKQCLGTYRRALWVPEVVGEPTVVKEIVMRKKVLVPEINGAPAVTNERVLGPLERDGWYRIKDSWYETVCRFGRPWREETVGYLLEDGRILEENKELYDASVKFFFSSSSEPKISCVKNYKKAPWAKGLPSEVYKIVARDVPVTNMYIKNEVRGGWYTLSPEWYKKVCSKGRPYIPGVIGYLLKNGKIIPESKTLHVLASSYLKKTGTVPKKERPDICINELLTPTWVKTSSGASPIRMVALNTPETRKWIVPKPIPGTRWHNLNRSWYVNVCKHGRQWIPGVFGYRMASGQIFHETQEMFNSYINRNKRSYSEVSDDKLAIFDTVSSMLTGVLDRDDVDKLMNYLPLSPVEEFVDSAAKIYVFASKLINKPQIHLERLKRKQYSMKTLPKLDKNMMLPEVYKNPALNPATARMGVLTWKDYDERIDKKIKTVKERMLQGSDAVYMKKKKIRYDESSLPVGSNIERCSNDPVYYMEDGKMYCFDRKSLKGMTQNPKTGKNFSKNFLASIAYIKDPISEPEEMEVDMEDSTPPPEYDAKPRIQRQPNRASNLLKSIQKDISSAYSFGEPKTNVFRHDEDNPMIAAGPNVYCAQCNKSFKDPKFKTTFKGNVINFCTTKCFEDFNF